MRPDAGRPAGPWDAPSRRAGRLPRGGATRPARLAGTDFRGAMRRNVRNTWLLSLAVVALACGFGYALGWGLEILAGRHPAQLQGLRPSAADLLLVRSGWGLRAALAAAALAALWSAASYVAADDALLALADAREVTPHQEPLLHNVVEEMAIAGGMPKPRVFVIDGVGLNAFATGLRPSKSAVAVTTGLLDRLNREELQAVVAHECGHILNGDIRHSVMLGAVVGLVAGAAGAVLRLPGGMAGGAPARGRERGGVPLLPLVLAVWLLFALVAPLLARLMRLAVSRQREYLADATAAMLTRNPVALASALAKISEGARDVPAHPANEHLYIVSPLREAGTGVRALLSTHPPTGERIRRLLSMRD